METNHGILPRRPPQGAAGKDQSNGLKMESSLPPIGGAAGSDRPHLGDFGNEMPQQILNAVP